MDNISERVPTLGQAEKVFEESSRLNPGPWTEHSLNAAKSAKLIADCIDDMDGETAYILGLLHDIGRRFGVTSMRHVLDGYNFTKEKGWDLVAQISLTHSFPFKNIKSGCGKWDCSEEEYAFVNKYIEEVEYTPYDKLIQLCDALALPSGYCLIEKRLMDVAMRHGFNEYTLDKWRATFDVQKYFEDRIGKSIYEVLPNIKESTFGF